jgi:drug/metabolite transporter (DMT)-like permease
VRLTFAIAAVLALNLAGSFLIKLMARLGPDPLLPFVLIGGVVILVAALRVFGWLLLGRFFQLSFIHPFLSLNYVLAVFLGMVAFDEPFAWNRLLGGAIITLSVLVLTRSKHQREADTDFGATGGMF